MNSILFFKKARLIVDSHGLSFFVLSAAKKLARRLDPRVNSGQVATQCETSLRKFNPRPLDDLSPEDRQIAALENLLSYTKGGGKTYSATKYPAGYHSIEVYGKSIVGQRNSRMRLDSVPFDFSNKTVLDIGCNQGGMLFEISDRIKWGVGLDYDTKMINVCNKISQVKESMNTYFYSFNIDREEHALIQSLLPEENVDIIFLLSVCMWISEWRSLISFCAQVSSTLLFESNGTTQLQEKQFQYLQSQFDKVELIREQSDDDKLQSNRKLYLAQNLSISP